MKVKSLVLFICFFACFSILIASGCKKDTMREKEELTVRFEGKYKIIKATADHSVDLNLDGSASSDLFLEIPYLEKAYLALRVNTQTGPFVYSQLWPNQFVSDPAGTNTTVYVHFVNQATAANFSVDEDKTKLNVFREESDPSFPLPLSVRVLPNDNLKVLMEKNIYTKGEWSKVTIEVVYERFSNEL
jgi:hypothetical protein